MRIASIEGCESVRERRRRHHRRGGAQPVRGGKCERSVCLTAGAVALAGLLSSFCRLVGSFTTNPVSQQGFIPGPALFSRPACPLLPRLLAFCPPLSRLVFPLPCLPFPLLPLKSPTPSDPTRCHDAHARASLQASCRSPSRAVRESPGEPDPLCRRRRRRACLSLVGSLAGGFDDFSTVSKKERGGSRCV